MARKRRPRNLLPEEELVARLLPEVFAGVVVEQYDDGSEDGMYDLRLRGPFDAAVEVGQVTDEVIREANGHWAEHLQPHRTTDLTPRWLFTFSDEPAVGEAARYPG